MKAITLTACLACLLALAACGGAENTETADASAAAADNSQEPAVDTPAVETIAVSDEFKAAESEYHKIVATIWHEGYEVDDIEVIKANAPEAVSAVSDLLKAAEAEENMKLTVAVTNVYNTARALLAEVNGENSDEKIKAVAERYHNAYHDLKELIK